MNPTRSNRHDDPASGRTPVGTAALVVVVALAGVACADSEFSFTDPSQSATITINHRVPQAEASSTSARTVSTDVTVDEEQGFTVDSVVVIMRELQVGREGTECAFGSPGTDGDGGDGRDCEEAFIRTSDERLPTEEEIDAIVDQGMIEPGTFDRIGFRFNRLDPGQPEDSDVIAALNSDFRNVSVLIVGSFQGEEFTLGLDRDSEEMFSTDSPLTLEQESSGSVTLVWNVEQWFDAPDGGGLINPVDAMEDESLADQIEANLVETLEVETSVG